MSSERTITDADVDAIADALADRLAERGLAPRAPRRRRGREQRDEIEVSEHDRAAARAAARRLGLVVRPGRAGR